MILVSPMRRALMTAWLLFKDHKDFSRLKFVVHPLLRENTHTSCDIPDDIDTIRKEFSYKIPQLDFHLME
jgi:hypothetical protein